MPGDLLAQDGLVEEGAEAVGLVDGGHVHQRDGHGGQEELAHSQHGGNDRCKKCVRLFVDIKMNSCVLV